MDLRPVQKHGAVAPSRVASVILALAGVLACDREAELRAEARVLARQLSEISDNRPFVERSAALEALANLPLRSREHARTRDLCLAAQRGMFDAETAQAAARKALEEAQNQATDGTISKQNAEAIASSIASSNRALSEAKTRFPECERAVRKLVTEAH